MDFLARFAPLMAEALHLAAEVTLPLEDIRTQITAVAEAERRLPSPKAEGLPDPLGTQQQALEDARFAAYAFVDEKLLNAQRLDAADWLPFSLQVRYFKTTEAGTLFFERFNTHLAAAGIPKEDKGIALDLAERLDRLQAKSCPDVVRLFALCLLYGFKGSLFRDAELLARVRKSCQLLLKDAEGATIPFVQRRAAIRSVRDILESLSYVFVPIAVCAAFWLFCADIVSRIPLK
ncbi:MAG: DotU family type IV/VI secretion system protein [Desulfovibrio sp.]|nr:DotU family type IV/VI secretion system protein [Desulfovibrio sp.]